MSLALAGALLLSACATQPAKLGATDVSTLAYAKYDCDQIAAESDRVSRRMTGLYDDLKKKADNDEWQMGVGLILLWPTLFLLEGGDGPDATEYRQLKGEYAALQQTAIAKRCGLTFRDIDAELKAKAEADRKADAGKRNEESR